MGSKVRPRLGFAWLICFALVSFLAERAILADAGARRDDDSIGLCVPYVSPDAPLQSGTGWMIRYSHSFTRRANASTNSVGVIPRRRSLVLESSLSGMSLDRDAEGVTRAGEVSLSYLSVGLLESWSLGEGNWTLGAGGGLDYFSADGKGKYSSTAPIGITNSYDVDSGFGSHVALAGTRSLGSRWEIVFSLGYLFAKLDGQHRFVISGVSGAPISADFDLQGPQASLGFACRF